MKKRVAWLLRDLNRGGMQKVALRLMNGLELDSEAILLSRGQMDGDLRIRKTYVPLPSSSNRACRLVGYGRVCGELRRVLRARKPQALVTFGHSVTVMAALSILGMSSPPAFFPSLRNSLQELRGSARPLVDPVDLLTKFSLRRARGIVAVSHALRKELLDLGLDGRRIRVVYNGLDLDSLRARAADPVDHPWLRESIPILCSVGRLSYQKNQGLLLEAVARLRPRRRARVWLIGEGEDEAALRARARELGLAEDVGFLGYRENPYPYMAQAAAVVLTSRFEGFPNVLIEAMAAGAALVSVDCPTGPSEIVRSGTNGLLVPPDSPDELGAAIERVLGSPELRERLRRGALADAPSYDFGRTLESFRSLLEGGRGWS